MRNIAYICFSILVFSAIAFVFPKIYASQSHHAAVCPGPAGKDNTRCHAQVVVDNQGKPNVTTTPAGYSPQQFLGGYNLGTGLISANRTIAIVDAYDDPNIKSDLDTYNQQFGLPFFPNCSSTVTTSCFQKVDQRGGTVYPQTNAGWALEISLDVEVAHAVCQNCKILLVEADSNSFTNLMAAVDTAKNLGATVISNSYGGNEFSTETSYDSHFTIPGVAVTVSSGDSGYGVEYPAASQYVTAVGGTTLNLSGTSYVSELAWSGAGSGCSAFEPIPSFQTADSICSNRKIADVSADADPNTGAAVYDSVRFQGRKGWFQVGGTSLSSPLIAGVYALSGNTSGSANSLPYTLGSYGTTLRDVTSGSNGNCGTYLCNAGVGYDGPTGLGTPNGVGAF